MNTKTASYTPDHTLYNTIESAIKATVRITSSYDIRDKFNPAELDSQGKSVGSGFFIDNKGHILTCNHVVSDSIKIFVNIPDGGKKSYRARIISLYPQLDIAVIKIHDYQNKHYIKLGSSDECKMGSDTIAIGYPLGDETVKTTKGTVSGKKNHLIQTDTTINPGSSGGPLLNTQYEAIGVNSSKMTGQSTEGTSYIVPIDIFKTVMYQMMGQGSDVVSVHGSDVVSVHGSDVVSVHGSDVVSLSVQSQDISPSDNQHMEDITVIYKPNLYCDFQTLENETSNLLCHEYTLKNKSIEGFMLITIYKKSPLAICENPMNIYDILMEFDGKKIDCYGDVDTDCKLGKLDLGSYVLRCVANQNIRIKYFSVKAQTIIETFIVLKNEYLYQIPEIFYPQKINYLNIDGVVICQLTLDHISDIINDRYPASMACRASMYRYMLTENREEPRIFISRVLPESSKADSKNLDNSEGCVIVRANGHIVQTIDQFKSICLINPIIVSGKRYMHLEMSNRENITMCIDSYSDQ
jgi:serine protease Do